MSRFFRFWTITLALLLQSCAIPNAPTKRDAQLTAEAIRFIKEPQTGLCFAVVSSYVYGYYAVSIATVTL